MKKQNGINLTGWNNLDQSILKTNGMMQDLINPIPVPEWPIGNSALLESLKFQNLFEDMFKDMDLSHTINPLGLSELIQPLNAFRDINNFKPMNEMFNQISIDASKAMKEMMEPFRRSMEINTMGSITAFSNLNTSWMDAWYQSSEIFKTSGIIDSINNYENYEGYYDDEAVIKPEEVEEFQVTLNDLSDINEKNWQQKIMAAFEKWKGKNPVFVWALNFLFKIFIFILSSYFQTEIMPIAFSTIRSEPCTQSETLAVFDRNQKMNVIDEGVPYYYEIEFAHPLTGEIKTGWVSKKSVMVIEDEIIEEETVEEQ